MPTFLSIEVQLRGSFLATKPITVRALVYPECQLTKLSRRLANQLCLTEFRKVYLVKGTGKRSSVTNQDISLSPIIVHCKEGLPTPTTCHICPIVSNNEHDFLWDMTIGANLLELHPELLGVAHLNQTNRETKKLLLTSGHRFDSDEEEDEELKHGTKYGFASYRDIPVNHNHSDVLFEFNFINSKAVNRLVINKKHSQIYVIYEGETDSDGSKIYRYGGVPRALEEELEDALLDESGELSVGKVMHKVRQRCNYSIIDDFPTDTVLVNYTTMIEW